MNNTFRECRSMVNITGLLGDLVTYTAITVSILGLSRWNKNWNVRKSYSYVATTNKIRFHFQFPRGGNFRFAGTQAFLNSGEKNPCKVQVWGSQAVRCYTRVFKLLCTTCLWLNCGTNWVERVGMARLSMTPWAIMRETGVARDVNNPGQRATKTNQNCLGAVPAKDGFAGTAQNWKRRIFLCWGAMTYFGLVEIAPPKWPCC